MRRVLLAAAVVLALGASEANAAPFGPAEETAWTEAEDYWQRQPTLCTSITKEVVPAGSLGPPAIQGRATQPIRPTLCRVQVVERLGPLPLCTVMRHEYAHLLGYAHEDPELAYMPLCGAEEDAAFLHAQRWKEWRELRAICRGLPRPVARKRCGVKLRRWANGLQLATS